MTRWTCPCCRRPLPIALSRALRYVASNGNVLGRELSEDFKIRHSAADNRLRRLFDLGLLTREKRVGDKGGMAYVYNLAEPNHA